MERCSKFILVEKEDDLFDLQYCGLDIWTYIRFEIWREILIEKYHLTNAHALEKLSASKALKAGKRWFYNAYIRRQKIKKNTDILFYTHPRRVCMNGKYYCCYTSLLRECYPNSMMIERPEGYSHMEPAIEDDVYYIDRIVLESTLSWYVFKKRKRAFNIFIEGLSELLNPVLDKLENAYEVELNHDRIFMQSAYTVYTVLVKKKKFMKLLDRINPKLIVEVVSYSSYCKILNEWGKLHGVPAIEVQHGTMGRDHLAYNQPSDAGLMQFPDYIFVFSQFWKDTTDFPISKDAVRVVGFPYFEKQTDHYKKQNNAKAVVFISQGSIGDMLSKEAVELSELIKGSGWKIYYKLHPGEIDTWIESYPHLADCPEVEVVCAKDISIYEIFAKCTVQVGVYSTAIYEGFAFGLITYIYHGYLSEMFDELADEKYVEYVDSAKELAAKILQLSEDRESAPVKKFWEENALENMKKEIQAIMKNNC